MAIASNEVIKSISSRSCLYRVGWCLYLIESYLFIILLKKIIIIRFIFKDTSRRILKWFKFEWLWLKEWTWRVTQRTCIIIILTLMTKKLHPISKLFLKSIIFYV